ncbi:hypothetical protein UMM65_05170 [Aureibaculum sp. 2210JD6-5]|uniref:hypothetical protein n=1 Tax=Aureibaculum sp. 2210JD6-5 TaxID=3103957 RepID=UPI002AADA6AC|nr:hypothetical protein [Aureibaculum sp. 2210JD6-5]MDY7394622.1 hypothetical protein [Aureibaculum sp. 2210JD6-5]
MLKNIFSIILLVVLANFIIVSTIVSLVENTADISQVFDLSEEEIKESLEVQEILVAKFTHKEIIGCNIQRKSIFEYFLKIYDSLSVTLPLPPPKQKQII